MVEEGRKARSGTAVDVIEARDDADEYASFTSYAAYLLWSPYVIGQTIYIFILSFVMVALCNRADHYILPCDFFLLSSFSFFLS